MHIPRQFGPLARLQSGLLRLQSGRLQTTLEPLQLLRDPVGRDPAGGQVQSAPIEAPGGASDLCRRFGGAGRASAGGIDGLPEDRFEAFVHAFATTASTV